MDNYIDILFDGPPGRNPGRFIEVEDSEKHGINIGKWVQRGNYWALRIPDPRRIAKLEDQLHLALVHNNLPECPKCTENSIIEGCSGQACLLCDWENDLDEGASGE